MESWRTEGYDEDEFLVAAVEALGAHCHGVDTLEVKGDFRHLFQTGPQIMNDKLKLATPRMNRIELGRK